MLVDEAVGLYLDYLRNNTRPNTIRSFSYTLKRFSESFAGRDIASINEADIIAFVSATSAGCSSSTKTTRVSTVRAFINFVIEITDAGFQNPCMRPMIRKMYRGQRRSSPKLLDKDIVDEIIFRTTSERNRLILELMGRAGMRISEVLNIRADDINSNSSTIAVTQPKSGRAGEKVYVTKKLIAKLQAYIATNTIKNDQLLFAISYSTAYRMVRTSAKMVSAFLRPHDLRRHAATQASRTGIPLEIVSKVILRHADIATTQRYLGEIDPGEASRWVEHFNR